MIASRYDWVRMVRHHDSKLISAVDSLFWKEASLLTSRIRGVRLLTLYFDNAIEKWLVPLKGSMITLSLSLFLSLFLALALPSLSHLAMIGLSLLAWPMRTFGWISNRLILPILLSPGAVLFFAHSQTWSHESYEREEDQKCRQILSIDSDNWKTTINFPLLLLLLLCRRTFLDAGRTRDRERRLYLNSTAMCVRVSTFTIEEMRDETTDLVVYTFISRALSRRWLRISWIMEMQCAWEKTKHTMLQTDRHASRRLRRLNENCTDFSHVRWRRRRRKLKTSHWYRRVSKALLLIAQ